MSSYDPTDTQGDKRAKYRFFSTVRRGYRPSTEFTGAKSPQSGDGAPSLETSGDVTVDVHVTASEGPGATATPSKSLDMYGPEHVTGIDTSQVVRMEPPPGTGNLPPNYFPLVEFDTAGLPWLFSPVDHDEDSRTFPWLTLAVVDVSNTDAAVSVDTGSPNPVLETPAAELPHVTESWAWAHAQVVGSPHEKRAESGASTAGDPLEAEFGSESNITVSRLIGPRNLDPSTKYVAAVVPTFEAGRRVGLGKEPPDESGSNANSSSNPNGGPQMDLAWTPGADATVTLPVYHHWEFTTAEKGDFEYLVRKLESRRLSKPEYDVGSRPVDVTDPGPETLDYDDGKRHTVSLGGALQASPPGDWWYDRSDELRKLLNEPARIETGTGWQVVGAPIYGQWHAQRDTLLDLTDPDAPYGGYGREKPALKRTDEGGVHGEQDLQWVHDLNLTPSFRLAAAVGTDIVQDQQEKLMAEAWDQVGEIREANRLLGAAQLSRAALATTYERLAAPNYPRDRFLQYTAPAHGRFYLDNHGESARKHVERSDVPAAVFSPAFRRLTSGAGRLASRLDDASALETVVEEFLAGRLSTGHGTGPEGMNRVDVPGGRGQCEDLRRLAPPPAERHPPGDETDDEAAHERDHAGQDRHSDVTDAVLQLLDMLDTCERIDEDLDGMRSVLADGGPDPGERGRVRTLEGEALQKWDALNGRVTNFSRVVFPIARHSDRYPSVSDEFDVATCRELYGGQSGQSATLGDMTRPFSKEFLTESRFASFWLGLGGTRFPSLTDFRDPALAGDLGRPGRPPEGSEAERDAIAVTVPDVARAQGLVADVERAIRRILSYFGVGEGDDGAYLERLFCGDPTARPERVPLDPGDIEAGYEPVGSFEDRILERLNDPGLGQRPDPLDTVMAYPEFTTPMYRDLREHSEEYLLPGVDNVPRETLGALETNPAFIEAFMTGLNHEMASELLWRRYATDRRGSYFKRFWNQQSRLPDPGEPEKLDDILPIHRWEDKGSSGLAPSPLGSNTRTGERGIDRSKAEQDPGKVNRNVVLLVRGELLERYPNTDIYAAKADEKAGDRVPRWASSGEKQAEKETPEQKFPIFRGKLTPDITFFGFDLTPDEARSGGRNDLGWFFVLAEPPTETRFGLDIGQDDEQSPPVGVVEGSGEPSNEASADQVDEGIEHGWSGLSWKHFGEDSGTYLRVTGSRPDSNGWKTVAGTKWAEKAAWAGDESESKFTYGEEDAAEWAKNSGHMAYITWQKPVRVAVHADDMLARAASRNPDAGGGG